MPRAKVMPERPLGVAEAPKRRAVRVEVRKREVAIVKDVLEEIGKGLWSTEGDGKT